MDTEWNKIETVQKMQDYIKENVFKENFDLNDLYSHIGYSPRHCDRVFKELIDKTPKEYVKMVIISNSSKELLQTDKKILDIALESNFETHEGYTRAFINTFGITPNEYRRKPIAIPLFVQYPIKSYYTYLLKRKEIFMEKEISLCMITIKDRPKRKLVFLRSKKADDYFSYCDEIGCEWEGLFNSITTKLDVAAILELPEELMKKGYSNIAAGVEVPIDYNEKLPDGCEIVELEPCKMVYFESEPYAKEDDYITHYETVFKAAEKYNPKNHGYEYADNIAPRFTFGTESCARYAVPIK